MDNPLDKVIGMVCLTRRILTFWWCRKKAMGKRSSIDDYRVTKRGGKGVKRLMLQKNWQTCCH